MMRTLGADLVGMSTVPEVLAARHMGIRCLALSCVTNMAAGVLPEPIDHERVLEVGARAAGDLVALLREVRSARFGAFVDSRPCDARATSRRSTGCSPTTCSRPRRARWRSRGAGGARRARGRRSAPATIPATSSSAARRARAARARPSLRRVLNATRRDRPHEPRSGAARAAALERVVEVGGRLLEPRATTSTRARAGSRQDHVAESLRRLTGAEAALVVNNNAAAVLLALAALAEGREVLVSRGELIEIGDGFRIPDVLARSGARLVEVGTTNRTRAADYERAIGPDTAALLRVHQSNFRVVGFTEQPRLAELAEIAQRAGLPLVDDLGSGALLDVGDEPTRRREPRRRAPTSSASRATSCSAGRRQGSSSGARDLVERLRRHPLQRALRADKLTLAALEGTLALDLDPGARASRDPRAADARRAARGGAGASGAAGRPRRRRGRGDGRARRGRRAAARRAAELRVRRSRRGSRAAAAGEPPVVGIVRDGRLLLDARTLTDAEVDEVAARRPAGTPGDRRTRPSGR